MTDEPAEYPPLRAVPDAEEVGPGHYDLDAERIVLGAMMLSPDAADEAMEILHASQFYRAIHGTVFAAIAAQRSKDEPTDPVAIGHVLAKTGDLGRVGGGGYLAEMVSAVPLTANVGWYANVVLEHAQWRELGVAASRIGQMVARRQVEIGDARNRAQTMVHEATMQGVRSEYRRWSDLVGPALDRIEAAAEHEGPIGLSTGIRDLDAMLEGLRAGQLVIVAGRPGMGKSIFAVDLARHTAMRLNQTAVIFSLEMSEPEITNRILSSESGIALRAIEKGALTDRDWTKLARRVGEVEKAPLIIDDSPTLDLAEIRGKARRIAQRHDLGLVVVDYLQLLSGSGRENRSQEVGELSRGLKLLAKELGCPVLAASQLNRNPEARADRRPQVSDLRESGSLEQDADIVILLHRDAYYDPDKRPGEVDLIVGKNRNGPMGTVVACAQLHLTRIVDFASEEP